MIAEYDSTETHSHTPNKREFAVCEYYGFVKSIVINLGVYPAEVDDVVQDAICHVFQNIEKYDEERDNFKAWLAVVVRNVIFQHYRRRRREQSMKEEVLLRFSLEEGYSLGTIEHQISIESISYRLLHAFKRLLKVGPRTGYLVLMSDLEGKTSEETSLDLGIELSSVYTLRRRARKVLAHEYQLLEHA